MKHFLLKGDNYSEYSILKRIEKKHNVAIEQCFDYKTRKMMIRSAHGFNHFIIRVDMSMPLSF